jgi:ppGpp synthetase/RelA/SpoT-type nucleotidyltranferase
MARPVGTVTAMAEGGPVQPLPFEFPQFDQWYQAYSKSVLEPARLTFVRLLTERVQRGVSELDRHRIRVSGSRVKSSLRTWAKLEKPQYRDRVGQIEDVPELIDDLVGMRIVCNNQSDIARVQDMIGALPHSEGLATFGLAAEVGSEKLYNQHPKDSGYRAYHVNLLTHVPGLDGLQVVRGELQVRTLLQDGWGELTHEDTYKPGVELPPLVTTLARRMADLLATVDDLAQDLRYELDCLAQSAVEDSRASAAPAPAGSEALPGTDTPPDPTDLRELLKTEAASLVASLREPTSLASIAARLQGTFGTSIRRDWAGYGTFKSLLLASVPGLNIVNAGPGYVVPAGASPNEKWPPVLLDVLP